MCTTAEIVATDTGLPDGAVIGGVAPQFVSLLPLVEGDPNQIQNHLDFAIEINSRSFWGTKFCRAVAYHAAHTLALAYPALAQGSSGASGGGSSSASIQSLKAGDLSITYANAAQSAQSGGAGSESYGETPWGRMYLQLARNCRRSPALYFGC